MAKLSGFPEYTPLQQKVEDSILQIISDTYSSFGYANLRLRSIEPETSLLKKGETSKEIYLVSRLQDEEQKRELGLRFDLTIPFARYIEENLNELSFPFYRSSIGSVFRGERPQKGRFREFIQADIDIVGQGELPLWADREILNTISDALFKILGDNFEIRVNNRELLNNIYKEAGIINFEETLRIMDKLPKIGDDKVKEMLKEIGEEAKAIEKLIEFITQNNVDKTVLDKYFGNLLELENVIPDLSIARGLDYYTGNVFETFIKGKEDFGSIASGGRYDNLISKGSTKFPGVGMSIGVSRLVAFILEQETNEDINGIDTTSLLNNETILIIVPSENERPKADEKARELRSNRKNALVSPKLKQDFRKQFEYANKLGIQKGLILQNDGSWQEKIIN